MRKRRIYSLAKDGEKRKKKKGKIVKVVTLSMTTYVGESWYICNFALINKIIVFLYIYARKSPHTRWVWEWVVLVGCRKL